MRGTGADARPGALIALLLAGIATLLAGCADSASPGAAEPTLVAVLGEGSERATGFAVAPGTVVTVAHAVAGRAPIRVQVMRGGGRVEVRAARLLALDRRTDLALLAVPRLGAAGLETARASEDDRLRVLVLRGERVSAGTATVRRAIDAHVTAPGSTRRLSRPALELETRVRAGDSGAPALTEAGELAGVLFARSRHNADTAYAVDARAVEALLAAGAVPGGVRAGSRGPLASGHEWRIRCASGTGRQSRCPRSS